MVALISYPNESESSHGCVRTYNMRQKPSRDNTFKFIRKEGEIPSVILFGTIQWFVFHQTMLVFFLRKEDISTI